MNRTLMAVLVLLAAAGAGVYFLYPGGDSPSEPALSTPVPTPEPAQPRYPVPAPEPEPSPAAPGVATGPDVEPQAPAPEPAPPALPELGASDDLATAALQQMFRAAESLRLFNTDQLIRRLVVTIDNLPRQRLPHKQLALETATGPFLVSGSEDDGYYIRADNARRYSPYVKLLESLDRDSFVRLYVRYYPLLQSAYAELGYPDAYFNDRLVEVIDHLLATPEVERPVRLVRPHVLYRYADPELEALSAGQKVLIRMGADNADRVRAMLVELRARLVDLAPRAPQN